MGALEPIALLIVGAFIKWGFDVVGDRQRKSDEADKALAAGESKLKEKVAALDKANSTAIATLTTGMEHIVQELAGIRGDMKEHRTVVFARIDRNENEIKEVKALVQEASAHLKVIESKLGAEK